MRGVQLRALAAELVHWMTGVPSFILLADIGDQRLRTLQLNFEGGNQRVFRVNDYVSRFPLKFKTNRKLHLCALPISVKSSTIQWGGVKLTKLPIATFVLTWATGPEYRRLEPTA